LYRVVIADDLPECLAWLRGLLKGSQDFQVVASASTGREALRLAELLRPDLVIADLDMPDLDGSDVAGQLHKQQPEIKVILVSVHTDQEYQTIAREAGALAFIPKGRLSLAALRQALGPMGGQPLPPCPDQGY
jgi:DNA-binding NarL/FixJ family response regulator